MLGRQAAQCRFACVLEAENSVESAHFFGSVHRFDRDVEAVKQPPRSVHRFDRDVETTEHFLKLALYPLPLIQRLPATVPGKGVSIRDEFAYGARKQLRRLFHNHDIHW